MVIKIKAHLFSFQILQLLSDRERWNILRFSIHLFIMLCRADNRNQTRKCNLSDLQHMPSSEAIETGPIILSSFYQNFMYCRTQASFLPYQPKDILSINFYYLNKCPNRSHTFVKLHILALHKIALLAHAIILLLSFWTKGFQQSALNILATFVLWNCNLSKPHVFHIQSRGDVDTTLLFQFRPEFFLCPFTSISYGMPIHPSLQTNVI